MLMRFYSSSRLRATALVLALGMASGATGCSSEPIDKEVVSTVKTATGEELFRGLFFAQGTIAGLFPEVWHGLSLADLAKRNAASDVTISSAGSAGPQSKVSALTDNHVQLAVDGIVADLRLQDAAFLDAFAAAMRSGDRLRIDDYLTRGSQLVKDIVQKRSAGSTPMMWCDYCWTEEAVAAYSLVAVVTAVAIAIVVVWDKPANPIGGADPLSREYLVDLIATRLRAQG